MTVREWQIETPRTHAVRLEHGWISGTAKLFIDEELVFERPTTIVDYGLEHKLIIDDLSYVVSIRPRFFSFSYSFNQSDEPLKPETSVPRKPLRFRWIWATLLFLFTFAFVLVGFGVPIPIGKFAAPFPLPVRMLFAGLGFAHIPIIIWVVSRQERQVDAEVN